MASQALVGTLGSVTIKVRGGTLPGEVKVVVQGIAHYYIAYAEQPIPVGREVLVINARGARQVDVEPWRELTSELNQEPDRGADDASGRLEGK